MANEYGSPTPAAEYEIDPVTGTAYRTGVLDLDQPLDQSSPEPADVAKDQAAAVGNTAADAGQHVASVAKDQAANVVGEAVQQGKDLLGQTRSELQDQAATQQQRVASGIRSLGDELGSMAERSEQDGMATDLVRQAAQRAGQIASWLDQRDPGALLQEVKTFAQRRPGMFLAIAAGAGLAAGRLTRGTVANNSESTPSPAPASLKTSVLEPVTPVAMVPPTEPVGTWPADGAGGYTTEPSFEVRP